MYRFHLGVMGNGPGAVTTVSCTVLFMSNLQSKSISIISKSGAAVSCRPMTCMLSFAGSNRTWLSRPQACSSDWHSREQLMRESLFTDDALEVLHIYFCEATSGNFATSSILVHQIPQGLAAQSLGISYYSKCILLKSSPLH